MQQQAQAQPQDADGKQMHSDFYRGIDYPQHGVV
jgi:hypothetical protein